MDHLYPKGGNHISNHVLACGNCNDIKRNKKWEEFLKEKCKNDEVVYKERYNKIEEWKDSKWKYFSSRDKIVIAPEDEKILENEIKKVNSQLDKSIEILKKIKPKSISNYN